MTSSFEYPNTNESDWSMSVTCTNSGTDSESRVASSKPPNPAPRIRTRCTGRIVSGAVELEHLDRVPAQDLVRDLLIEVGEHLLRVLLGRRPRRVRVRVVGLEADVVLADPVERMQTVVVGGEAAEDAPVVIGRGRFGNALL